MNFKKNALTILLSCSFAANVFAENIGGAPDSFTYTNETTNTEKFVLSTEEWVAIQIFAEAARSLPITQEEMRNEFLLGDLDFGSNYQELLKSYQSVHDISGQWLNVGGYREQMVDLATDIVLYSDDVLTGSKRISDFTNNMWQAVLEGDVNKGNRHLSVVKTLVKKMLKDTTNYYAKADDLSVKLTGFINTLDKEDKELKQVQVAHADILENNGSDTQKEIDRLIKKIEEANQEWTKWVTVAATTPTYAWVFPYGLIAAIGAASGGTANAVALASEINFIKEDLDNFRSQLKTEELTYLSWKLATGSITNTRDQLSGALRALEKLKGSWVLVVARLKAAVNGLNEVNSQDVIDNPDLWEALILSTSELEDLENRWGEIKDSTEEWVRNAYVGQIEE